MHTGFFSLAGALKFGDWDCNKFGRCQGHRTLQQSMFELIAKPLEIQRLWYILLYLEGISLSSNTINFIVKVKFAVLLNQNERAFQCR